MRLDERTSAAGVFPFFAGACAFTWLLGGPLALAWMRHATPPPYAVAAAGLSAFGPLVAALAIAGGQKRLADVFGRWRANPAWLLLALVTPMAIHLIATVLYVAIGGQPSQWLHPPSTPEQVAALVVFPLGEEFGWRGFAHPRMIGRYGLVKGSLALGALWGLWHLAYSVTPAAGRFDVLTFAMTMAELPLYSLVIAWVFERANRSMAVALAFHAGAHLDHIELAPRSDLRLDAMHLLTVAVAAAVAARSLAQADRLSVTHQRRRDDLRVRPVQARARRGGDEWRAHGRSRTRPRHAGACVQQGLRASARASGRERVASTVARSTPGG